MLGRFLWPVAGFAIALLLWAWGAKGLEESTPIAAMFAPMETFEACPLYTSPSPRD